MDGAPGIDADPLRRQVHRELALLGDPEAPDHVDGQVGAQEHPRPSASPASSARKNEPRNASVVDPRRRGRWARPACRRRPRRPPDGWRASPPCPAARPSTSQRELEHGRARTAPARTTVPATKFMTPMKSATNGEAGLAVDLERRADLLDRAVVHDHDAVGHGERLLLVVGHHDRRHAEAPLELLDLVAQVHPHLGVERGQRLVEQQEPGRGGQRAGQRDPLLLAAGELGRDTCRRASASPTRSSSSWTRRATSALRHPRVLEPVGDVLGRRSGSGRARRTGTRCRNRAWSAAAPRCRGPSCSIRPVVWMSSPAIARSSVVLPHPDGPRKQTNSPSYDLERDVVEGGEGAELLGEPARSGGTASLPSPYFFGSDFAP